MNSKSETCRRVEKMSNGTHNHKKVVIFFFTMLLLMYPFLCIAFGVQTLPVCHERSTIIGFVQCRACFFFFFASLSASFNMNVKEREGNNNNNNTKPEKPFFSSLQVVYVCVCVSMKRDRLQFGEFS